MSLKKLETNEQRNFWKFVERTARVVNGDARVCVHHIAFSAKKGKPLHACETCWDAYFTFQRTNPVAQPLTDPGR